VPLYDSKTIVIHFSSVLAILAEYSFHHSEDMLAKMLSQLTEFEASSHWATIKVAVNKLHLDKTSFSSDNAKKILGEKILQITLANLSHK
jgi:hypothetical protein